MSRVIKPIRLYFRCKLCGVEFTKDLPQTQHWVSKTVEDYQKRVFMHGCVGGDLGVGELTGAKEL